jgi:hypothetical protein
MTVFFTFSVLTLDSYYLVLVNQNYSVLSKLRSKAKAAEEAAFAVLQPGET